MLFWSQTQEVHYQLYFRSSIINSESSAGYLHTCLSMGSCVVITEPYTYTINWRSTKTASTYYLYLVVIRLNFLYNVLKQMRKWTVTCIALTFRLNIYTLCIAWEKFSIIYTQVMAESCNLDTEHILVCDFKFWLLLLQTQSKLTSDITNPTWNDVWAKICAGSQED